MCVYVYMRTSKKDVNDGECDVEGKRVDDKEKALQSRVNCPRFFYEARKRTDKCVFLSMRVTRVSPLSCLFSCCLFACSVHLH